MSSAVSDPSGQLERISPFTGRGIYSFGHSWELAETRIQDLSSAFVRRLVIFSRVLIAAVGVSLTGLEDERNKQATTAAWRQHLGREQVCVQGCSTGGTRRLRVRVLSHTRVCAFIFVFSLFPTFTPGAARCCGSVHRGHGLCVPEPEASQRCMHVSAIRENYKSSSENRMFCCGLVMFEQAGKPGTVFDSAAMMEALGFV